MSQWPYLLVLSRRFENCRSYKNPHHEMNTIYKKYPILECTSNECSLFSLSFSSSLLWAFTFKRCFPYFHGKFSWKTPQRDVKTFHRCHCSSFLWLTCFSALLHSVVLLCQMLLGGVYFWCSNNLNISSILNTPTKELALLFNLCNISDLKKRRDSEYTAFYLDISPKHAHSIKSLPLWVQ